VASDQIGIAFQEGVEAGIEAFFPGIPLIYDALQGFKIGAEDLIAQDTTSFSEYFIHWVKVLIIADSVNFFFA